jgi:hypothetical protein
MFFNKKYAKKGTRELSSWEKLRKLDAAIINTFTVTNLFWIQHHYEMHIIED